MVRIGVEAGLRCSGRDVDPLAALMARAWTTPADPAQVTAAAGDIAREARELPGREVEHPADPETARFVAYWFAPRQQEVLARLGTALRRRKEPARGLLAVALSRIIVSKEKMASLARDTSHSRPHRVATSNDSMRTT